MFFQVCLLFSQVCLLFSQDKRHSAQQTTTPMRLQSVANNKRVRKCKLHHSFPLSRTRARAYRTRVLCFLLSHLSHTPLKPWYFACYIAIDCVLTKLLLSHPLSFQCDSKVKAISSCCHLSLPMFTRGVEGCDSCDSKKQKSCIYARTRARGKHTHEKLSQNNCCPVNRTARCEKHIISLVLPDSKD